VVLIYYALLRGWLQPSVEIIGVTAGGATNTQIIQKRALWW
jgi:hypothetical protein